MSADQIRIGALETNDLFLISSPKNKKNQIRLEGILGTIESNTFEANLSYTQDNTSTAIDISEFTLKSDSIVWELRAYKRKSNSLRFKNTSLQGQPNRDCKFRTAHTISWKIPFKK